MAVIEMNYGLMTYWACLSCGAQSVEDPHGMPLPDAEPGRYGWLS